MAKKKVFDKNKMYRTYLRRYSLEIFREGIGKYTDKLKKYQSPNNKSIEQVLNRNSHINEWLDNHIKKDDHGWGLILIDTSAEMLQILKSTLPLLLTSKYSKRKRLEKDEEAPPIAFEEIDDEISKIKELMTIGIFEEIPIQKLLGRKTGKDIKKTKEAINKSVEESKYQVALSYASENLEYVEKVAENLNKLGINIFFDKHEVVKTWGVDLAERFKKYLELKQNMLLFSVQNIIKEKHSPVLN